MSKGNSAKRDITAPSRIHFHRTESAGMLAMHWARSPKLLPNAA
jgi:hypothetical protein